MKITRFKSGKLAFVFSALFFVLMLTPSTTKAQVNVGVNVNVGINDFYNHLSPYGNWVQNPEYGTVWVPRVDNGFRPYYTNGYWVNTQYGNTWMSNYQWGWATFHYGRWGYSNYYGWFWIPGSEWGPAWVTWRQGGGYYGWAPMGPGVSINISFGHNHRIPNNYWSFVPYQNLYAHDLYRYHHGRNTTIINNTTIIQNVYRNNSRRYVAGPSRRDYKRHTGRRVRTYKANYNSRPGRSHVKDNVASFYRPTSNRGNASSRRQIKRTTSNRRPAVNKRQTTPRRDNNVRPRRTTGNDRTTNRRPQATWKANKQTTTRRATRPSVNRKTMSPRQQAKRTPSRVAPSRPSVKKRSTPTRARQATPRRSSSRATTTRSSRSSHDANRSGGSRRR